MSEKNRIEKTGYQLSEMPAYRQFLILLGLFCVGLLGTLCILKIIFLLSNVRNIAAIMIITEFVQDIFVFALPAFLFAKIFAQEKNYFQFHAQSPRVLWLLAIVIAFAAIPVSDFFGQINEWIPIPKSWAVFFKTLEDAYSSDIAAILNFKNFGSFLFSIALIALLPAVTEELFFRGALQQVMLKWTGKVFPAILITAIIFSAIHGSYYGFLGRALLGVVLGYVYYYGKNIWLNMLIHFINNAVALIALYAAYGSKPLPQNAMDDSSSVTPLYLQIIGILVLVAALNLFAKKSSAARNF